MSAKRIRLIILLLLIAAAGIIGYQVYRLSRPSSLPSMVPANAGSVIFVHALKLLPHIDELKSALGGDTAGSGRMAAAIKSFRSGGADLMQGVAVFTLNRQTCGILVLKDRDAWDEQVQENKERYTDLRNSGKITQCHDLKSSLYFAWNRHTLIFSDTAINDAETILGITPENSFQTGKAFDTYTDSAVAWFWSDTLQAEGMRMTDVSGTLMIRDGRVHIEAAERGVAAERNMTAMHTPDSLTVLHAGRGLETLNKRMRELSLIILGATDKDIDKKDFTRFDKTLVIGGKRIVPQVRVTYTYDDEFNLKADTLVSYDTLQSACLHAAFETAEENFSACMPKGATGYKVSPERGTLFYAYIGKPGIPLLMPDSTATGLRIHVQKQGGGRRLEVTVPLKALPAVSRGMRRREPR